MSLSKLKLTTKMKRLLFIYLMLGGFEGWGQTAGVTVITHGFDLLAGTGQSGIGTWIDHGYEIADYYNATHDNSTHSNPKATVFINDRITGLWRKADKVGKTNGTGDPTAELIFVYDWTLYSNDLKTPYDRGLEASADHLFALLTQPNIYTPSGIAGQMLTDKQTHFIGHSRGGVLLLQVLHRIKNYFPLVNIEHLTLLDPHPTARLGDVLNTVDSHFSLPSVQGRASYCYPLICSMGVYSTNNDPDGVRLQVPENVIKAESYYRINGGSIVNGFDGDNYEPVVGSATFSIAPFSGVPLNVNNTNNKQLNNTIIDSGSSVSGGAHSGVHEWYFLTVDLQKPLTTNQNFWFTQSNGNFFPSNLGNGINRPLVGYAFSRLRGGYSNLPSIDVSEKVSLVAMNVQLSNRLKNTISTSYPESLLNGDLTKKSTAGWFNGDIPAYNGSNGIKKSGNLVELSNDRTGILISGTSTRITQKITHNYFYCPVGMAVKVIAASSLGGNPKLNLTINGISTTFIPTNQSIISTNFKEYLFNIDQIQGQVGSITLEEIGGSMPIKIKSVELVPCNLTSVTVQPYVNDVLNTQVGNWNKEFVQKATKWGFINKYAWGGDNENITIGEASKSIIIVANALGFTGYNQLVTDCWEAQSYQPYINYLTVGNFLPPNSKSEDLISIGLLSDILSKVIMQGGTSTYPYHLNRADQNTVIASNASYRSSILDLYNSIGYRSATNRWKIASLLLDGKYDIASSGRKITGNENVTKSIFAKLLTGAYEFKYYQANNNTRSARLAANARINSTFDDIIILGSKAEFDNEVTGAPPIITVEGSTEYLRSGQTKNFSFSNDLLNDGTQVKFYWSIDGSSQGLTLIPMSQYPINFQGVTLTVPTVTSPKTFHLYIHLSTIDGRTAEMFKEIIVSPNNPNGNVNLTNGEYFIDNDLGVGQVTALPITLNNYGVDASIPIPTANLTQGVHIVGVRVKDSNNQWSLTHTKTFLIIGSASSNGLNNIEKVEYFIDSLKQDLSNLIIINVTPDGDLIAVPLSINLPLGIHTVSFRVKDSEGKSSLFHTKTFLVLGIGIPNGQNSIVKCEYFFDNDPNEGNRIQQNVSLDANNQVVIPITINLPQGIHSISFRVKDANGLWSLFHTKTFLVIGAGIGNGAISQVEYFIDNDPGFNNGTQIPFTLSNNQMIFDINLSSLSQGVHVLYVRVKTNQGKWSLTHARVFVVIPNVGGTTSIDRIEYFIDDTDPGLGNGINVTFVSNSEGGVTANFDVAIGQISTGIHQLTVRARDSNGNWSPIRNNGFEVTQPTVCQNMISIKSGSWNDPTTWSCGRVPTASDDITIDNGHTVNVPTGSFQVKNVSQKGTLQFQTGAFIFVVGL